MLWDPEMLLVSQDSMLYFTVGPAALSLPGQWRRRMRRKAPDRTGFSTYCHLQNASLFPSGMFSLSHFTDALKLVHGLFEI